MNPQWERRLGVAMIGLAVVIGIGLWVAAGIGAWNWRNAQDGDISLFIVYIMVNTAVLGGGGWLMLERAKNAS